MSLKGTTAKRHTLDPALTDDVRRAIAGDTSAPITIELIERHDPRFVVSITDKLRGVVDEAANRAIGWRTLRQPTAGVTQFVERLVAASPLTALPLTTSASGYLRQAALAVAEAPLGPFSLALLVNRLNDWVGNVRQTAELRLQLLSIKPDIAAECIEYLWQFEEFGRASAIGREIVSALVRSDAVAASVRATLLANSDDRTVRLVRHLLRTNALDEDLATLATQHKHPRVRALAAKTALEGVFSWRNATLQKRSVAISLDRTQLALPLLADRSVDVQSLALQHLSQNMEDQAALEAILRRYLTHPRRKLAELAQWRLNKLDIDWLDWLRQEFERQPTPALARTLGRVGTRVDGESIWKVAAQQDERSRLALSFAAARLAQTDAVELCQRIALDDADITLARSAASVLLDAGEPISVDRLLAAAQSAATTFSARGLYAHIRRHALIRQLLIFCQLELSGYPPQQMEFARIARRLNRGKFEAAAAELDALRELAPRCPRVGSWIRRLHIA